LVGLNSIMGLALIALNLLNMLALLQQNSIRII
jgi:hypothetical protein